MFLTLLLRSYLKTPEAGFEPATLALGGQCSKIQAELPGHDNRRLS